MYLRKPKGEISNLLEKDKLSINGVETVGYPLEKKIYMFIFLKVKKIVWPPYSIWHSKAGAGGRGYVCMYIHICLVEFFNQLYIVCVFWHMSFFHLHVLCFLEIQNLFPLPYFMLSFVHYFYGFFFPLTFFISVNYLIFAFYQMRIYTIYFVLFMIVVVFQQSYLTTQQYLMLSNLNSSFKHYKSKDALFSAASTLLPQIV